MAEGTWVGLDVHARKVVAGVLDAGSGELRSLLARPRGAIGCAVRHEKGRTGQLSLTGEALPSRIAVASEGRGVPAPGCRSLLSAQARCYWTASATW